MDVWKLFVIVCAILLVGCKSPKPKPLDKVKNENISINFKVDYFPALHPLEEPYSSLFIRLFLNNEKDLHIQIESDEQMHAYLNGTEYLLEPVYCYPAYGSRYFCGYKFPHMSNEQVANLVEPLTIALEIRRRNGQLIAATATLPRFFTMTSSIPAEKKYDPLTDVLQVAWMSSVPVKQIEYFAGQFGNRNCSGSVLKTPQVSDTYVQYNANELGLDTNSCSPMSYASVAVETVENVTAMQTNVSLASANIRLNQRVLLQLLSEP
jgi:uncharacterized protein YcfL